MGNLRVLVVEDDIRLGNALSKALQRQGYEVLRAVTAAEALEAPPVDLILLDMGLPDGDGLDICRRLRREGVPLSPGRWLGGDAGHRA